MSKYEDYSYSLIDWISDTIDHPSPKAIDAIRALWDYEDSWEEIKEKFETEDSTWQVWFEDGIRAYMKLDEEEDIKANGGVYVGDCCLESRCNYKCVGKVLNCSGGYPFL